MKNETNHKKWAAEANRPHTYFGNLKTEEEQWQATADAEAFLGPNGRMEYPLSKNVKANVVVETVEHGKLWYGDLTMDATTKRNLENLAKAVGAEIYLSEME